MSPKHGPYDGVEALAVDAHGPRRALAPTFAGKPPAKAAVWRRVDTVGVSQAFIAARVSLRHVPLAVDIPVRGLPLGNDYPIVVEGVSVVEPSLVAQPWLLLNLPIGPWRVGW